MLSYIRKVTAARNDQGASAVEYGLLVAAIAALIVLIVFALGGVIKEVFTDTCNSVQVKIEWPPGPLSATVSVRASLSKLTRIFSSASPSYSAPSASAEKRSLSQASDALEISSRRKISLLL